MKTRIRKRRPPFNKGGADTWGEYHDAIRAVARRYGKVGWGADADFYHSGDWFHQLSDGFALRTSRGITAEALRDFQSVVARHHPDATLSLGGDIDTPILGSGDFYHIIRDLRGLVSEQGSHMQAQTQAGGINI